MHVAIRCFMDGMHDIQHVVRLAAVGTVRTILFDRFRHFCNTDDSAGRYVDRWPMVEDRETV